MYKHMNIISINPPFSEKQHFGKNSHQSHNPEALALVYTQQLHSNPSGISSSQELYLSSIMNRRYGYEFLRLKGL